MKKTNKMIKISLLASISVILMYFDVPVIPLFPWLKMDLSDVPALMAAFGFGPLAGVSIELFKNILYAIIKGSGTGFIGETANFIIGSSLILPAGIIYHRNKSKKNAILGMICGFISIEIVGILANVYFLIPAYGMQMSQAELMKYITVGLLPLNGIKAIVVSVITYLLYKRVSVSIFKVEPNFGTRKKEI